MFTTLRKADEVRKDALNSHYLFERIEKSGIPKLISETSGRGEFKLSFDWGAVLPRWDSAFVKRVIGTLRDFGYEVNDPKSSTEFMEISWEGEVVEDTPEDDEYL